MIGFEYPALAHVRRHGPGGYNDYGSYRDWLRDEFRFLCVYCLHREQWYCRGGTFHIDHFVPVGVDGDRVTDYANLIYACTTCNEAKSDILGLPDPCVVPFGECLEITLDGRVLARNKIGETLREALRLDSAQNVAHRRRWIKVLKALQESGEVETYRELMGFPQDLPDLRTKRPPKNDKPAGAASCYFALRERGDLPETY
jgi:hypothetical protein